MPTVFGCVNAAEGIEGALNSHIEQTPILPAYATFGGGYFAAIAHGGRKAAWLDQEGNAWAVFGERVLSSSAETWRRASVSSR